MVPESLNSWGGGGGFWHPQAICEAKQLVPTSQGRAHLPGSPGALTQESPHVPPEVPENQHFHGGPPTFLRQSLCPRCERSQKAGSTQENQGHLSLRPYFFLRKKDVCQVLHSRAMAQQAEQTRGPLLRTTSNIFQKIISSHCEICEAYLDTLILILNFL